MLQERHRRLHQPHRAQHVGLEPGPPRRLVSADRQRTDIGDDHVETAQRRGRCRHEPLQRRAVGYVRDLPERLHPGALQRVDRRLHLIRVTGADRDRRALGREAVRDRSADAFGATGDEGAAALQSEVHRYTPSPAIDFSTDAPSVYFGSTMLPSRTRPHCVSSR